MIAGRVTANREATTPLSISGPDRQARQITAIIDTGFNGYLTLPEDLIVNLNLSLVGNRRATLGDGNVATLDAYLATVLWHGREREVLLLQAEGEPLLGMALLYGSRLTLDAVVNGPVVINEIPTSD